MSGGKVGSMCKKSYPPDVVSAAKRAVDAAASEINGK